MKLGTSPRHKYSSQSDDVPQAFLRRKISSVKVEPIDPIKTSDIAQMVLSSIASTFTKIIKTNKGMQQEKQKGNVLIAYDPLLIFTTIFVKVLSALSSDLSGPSSQGFCESLFCPFAF